MDSVEILFQLGQGAKMPEYATAEAAGMDLCAAEGAELQPGERRLIPTGLRAVIPTGYEGQVRPRSGLALRKGIGMVNAPGTIDSDYRGEIGVILINMGQDVVKIESGERIAQMVICPVIRAKLVSINDIESHETVRGVGGFGSTGK